MINLVLNKIKIPCLSNYAGGLPKFSGLQSGPDQEPGLKGWRQFQCPPKNTFSPGLYISNVCSVHLRSRLRRSAPLGRAIHRRRACLYRAAVVYPRPAAPFSRPATPHPVSAAAPDPTLRRRRFPCAHRTLRRTLVCCSRSAMFFRFFLQSLGRMLD